MSEALDIIIDASKPDDMRRLYGTIAGLKGVNRVTVNEYRPRGTDRQRRWYFGCFCEPFGAYLIAEGNRFPFHPKEAAHRILKDRFLTRYATNMKTGEALEFVLSTTKLSTVDWNQYLDECAAFLAELGIIVPDPSVYHEKPTKKELKQAAMRQKEESHA